MNLLHLRYAAEVARCGSLSKASQKLLIAQPNLSRAIKELEKALDVTLFERNAQGMKPTAFGRELFERAEKIFDELDSLEERCRETGHPRQVFSISVPKSGYLADAFVRFACKQDPESTELHYAEFSTPDIIDNVIQNKSLIGIARYSAASENAYSTLFNENQIEMYPLVEFSPVLIMSRTSPLATMPLIRLKDLDAYSEIMQEEEAVPQISASAGKLADPSGEKKRRIFVYDRASQLQLLSENPDTFLWAPSLPEKQLAAYRLVQRPCVDNRKKLRDTLIYRKEYDFTDLDKAFLKEVEATQTLHRVGTVLGHLPVKQE